MDKDKIYKFAIKFNELSEEAGLDIDETQYAIYLIQQSYNYARMKATLDKEKLNKGGK